MRGWIRHHRTRLGLSLLLVVLGMVLYFGYRGPASGREFLLTCMMVFGGVFMTMILVADLARCPRCNDDLGYFHGIGPFRNLYRPMPRTIHCKQCGEEIDRW